MVNSLYAHVLRRDSAGLAALQNPAKACGRRDDENLNATDGDHGDRGFLHGRAPAEEAARAQWQPVIRTNPCPFAYQPVCARKKGVLITYAKACVARANQSRVVSDGVCPEDCPTAYKPVCARDASGKRRTYANTCAAQKQKARIIRNARCLFPQS